MGVKYILEGSVQKSGNRVRITAQLINAVTDYHMWSENYDRDLSDIFALQDEITMKVMTAMQVKLTQGEKAMIWTEGTNSLDAYIHTIKGTEYFHQENIEAIINSRQEAEKAIKCDPNYISPYILLAATYLISLWWETGSERDNALKHLLYRGRERL